MDKDSAECHIVWQVVPGPLADSRKSLGVSDGYHLGQRHCWTVGASRTGRSAAR